MDIKNDDIIVNDFTESNAKTFRDQLLKRSAKDPNAPIIIYIDSYGGVVDSLNSMLATMRQIPNTIVTCCIGKAMSCGAVLLAAGDYRFCDSGSRILIHEVSAGTIDPVNEMENSVKESRRLNDQLMNFLAKRCNKSYKDIKKMMHDQDSRNIILNAKQALQFGIIDYVGMPVIKPMVVYNLETLPERKYEQRVPSLPKATKKKVTKKVKKKVTKKVKKKTKR